MNRLWLSAGIAALLAIGLITRNRALVWFTVGALTPFVLKYGVFGLGAWDKLFHPERLQADATGPYAVFFKPFLGALTDGMGN